MTIDEARRIAAIVGTADGGCLDCVGSLVDKLERAFPEFEWTHNYDAVVGELLDPFESDDFEETERRNALLAGAARVQVEARP